MAEDSEKAAFYLEKEEIMSYALLAFAIVMELIGTTFLKSSEGFTKLIPTLACMASYFICFFTFSKAVVHLNLGLAYATWSGVGIIASCLISRFLFGEKLTTAGLMGVALIVAGCILLNALGTER